MNKLLFISIILLVIYYYTNIEEHFAQVENIQKSFKINGDNNSFYFIKKKGYNIEMKVDDKVLLSYDDSNYSDIKNDSFVHSLNKLYSTISSLGTSEREKYKKLAVINNNGYIFTFDDNDLIITSFDKSIIKIPSDINTDIINILKKVLQDSYMINNIKVSPSSGLSFAPSPSLFTPSSGPFAPSSGLSFAPSSGLSFAPSSGLSFAPSSGLSFAPSSGLSFAPSPGLSPETILDSRTTIAKFMENMLHTFSSIF
jgi:hypothetical protein